MQLRRPCFVMLSPACASCFQECCAFFVLISLYFSFFPPYRTHILVRIDQSCYNKSHKEVVELLIVPASEFKQKFGEYLGLVGEQDIVITRNGKRIARLIDASRDKSDILDALTGILPADATLEDAREGRLRL